MQFEELTQQDQGEVRALILQGLAEHWGSVEPGLNPDLDDMVATYAAGRTLVVRDDHGVLMGTGTIVPRSGAQAEIVRMSVAAAARRTGIGRAIVDELLATATSWGMDVVVLETTTGWTDVVDFYRSCGFTVTHEEDSAFGRETWFERRLT